MRALREALGGLFVALLAACTVIGGIALAIGENSASLPITRTSTPLSTQVDTATLPPETTATAIIVPSATFAGRGSTHAAAASPTLTALPTFTAPPTTLATTQPAASATTAPTALPATRAPSPTPCGAPAHWVPYTVQRGDTLFRIGLARGETVASLKVANCLSSDSIEAGQIILVPPVAASATAMPSPMPTPIPSKTPVPAPLQISKITLINIVRDTARPPDGAVAFVQVEFSGGIAPYTFYNEGLRQLDNPVQALTKCGHTVLQTVRIDSADGQSVSQSYHFPNISCP